MPAKLKTTTIDGKEYAEVRDGKPLLIEDDGVTETAFDFVKTRDTIGRLTGESKSHREAAEAHAAKLKAFEGIDNVDEAREALTTYRNLKTGDLKKVEEVEAIKAAAVKSFQDQLKDSEKKHAEEIKRRDKAEAELSMRYTQEKLGNAFGSSSFIKEKVAAPIDFLRAYFGDRFKIEEGEIKAYESSGKKIFSRARPGEDASFDEAIEHLINEYPGRDQILKGSGSSGSGAQPGFNGGAGAKRQISRSEYDRMAPHMQRQIALDANSGKAQILDGA